MKRITCDRRPCSRCYGPNELRRRDLRNFGSRAGCRDSPACVTNTNTFQESRQDIQSHRQGLLQEGAGRLWQQREEGGGCRLRQVQRQVCLPVLHHIKVSQMKYDLTTVSYNNLLIVMQQAWKKVRLHGSRLRATAQPLLRNCRWQNAKMLKT